MDTGTGKRSSYRLLLVEDDSVIAGEMKRHLEKWGYEVICAEDFGNVLGTFAACSPHLVLMDIGLPFYNGYYWCAQIRQISKVPIIFVSSAGDNMNIVMAVNMGGDDFVTKPFEPEVLSAKVQAMLRRTYAFREQTNIMECRGAILNLTDASLLVNGEKLELTKNEMKLPAASCGVSARDSLRSSLVCCDASIGECTLLGFNIGGRYGTGIERRNKRKNPRSGFRRILRAWL